MDSRGTYALKADATARAVESGVSPGTRSCWWTLAGDAASLHLYFRVIERINQQIRQAAREDPRREVGGLLFGTVEQDPLRKSVIDSVPVLCDYRSGPSFRLSGRDMLHFREEIARSCAVPGRLMRILGCYRSHNGTRLPLDEEDLALAHECLSDAGSIFLLVHPTSPVNVGRFFFLRQGETRCECALVVPFDPDTLLAGRTTLPGPVVSTIDRGAIDLSRRRLAQPRTRTSPVVEEEAEEESEDDPDAESLVEPAPAPAVEPAPGLSQMDLAARELSRRILAQQPLPIDMPLKPAPQPPPALPSFYEDHEDPDAPAPASAPRPSRKRLWWGLAAAVLVAVFAALRYDYLPVPSGLLRTTPRAGTFVPLTVRTHEGLLEIVWDPSSRAIASAAGGILSVTDGAFTNELRLSKEELLGGRASHPRIGRVVGVELRLIVDAGSTKYVDRISMDDLPRAATGLPEADALSSALGSGAGSPKPRSPAAPGARRPASPRTVTAEPEPERDSAQSPENDPPEPAGAPATVSPEPESGPSAAEQLAQVPAEPGSASDPGAGQSPGPHAAAEEVPQAGTDNPAVAEQVAAAEPQIQAQALPAPVLPPPSAGRPESGGTEQAAAAPRSAAPSVANHRPSAAPAAPILPAFRPPQPIGGIAPIVVPASARSRISGPIQVSVRLYIDASGAVIGARPLTKRSFLTDIAVDAARRLRFSPARRNGRDTAGELVVALKLVKE